MNELPAMPALWRVYPRAVLRRTHHPTRGMRLPSLSVSVAAATIDPEHVARYNAAVGFPSGVIPTTYPSVFSFPLALALLSQRAWPLGLPGLVHLGIEFDRLGDLELGRPYRVVCEVGGATETERGLEFDLIGALSVDGNVAWRGVSRVLARISDGRRHPRSPAPDTNPIGAPTAEFAATGATARAYAKVSGDWNPIHLGVLPARVFGFRRPIAHGMWTLARTLAVTGGANDAGLTARFTAPVVLPASLQAHTAGASFAVTDAASGRTVLHGTKRVGIFPE